MPDADLLVHVHIPKCAGTSIWYWMARHMPSAHGFLYPADAHPWFFYDEAALSELGVSYVGLRCMSSHYFRVFPAECHGRRMRYFTLIRDPLQQFLSYARYERNVYRTITDETVLAAIPPDADRLTIREIARWILDSPVDVPNREAFQSDYLASYAWRIATGRGPRAGTPLPRWEPADWEAYRAERLRLAKETLAGFAVVGTVERFDATLELLARRATSWNVPLGPLAELERVNVSDDVPIDTDWISEDDPVGRRLLASLSDDYALYAYANELLDATLLSS